MSKKLTSILLLGTAIFVLYFAFTQKTSSPVVIKKSSLPFDGKNISFMLDRQKITLTDGKSEVAAAPGSASKVVTAYFGNEATGDLTGDGLPDTAFLVTQSTTGSGLFYYAVVAIKTDDGYKTTNAFFIGDRISPQSTFIPINAKELHINYAERKPGESMVVQPSVGAVLLLKVTPEGVLEGLMK